MTTSFYRSFFYTALLDESLFERGAQFVLPKAFACDQCPPPQPEPVSSSLDLSSPRASA